MPTEDELRAQLHRLDIELDMRASRHDRVEPYYELTEDGLVRRVPELIRELGLVNAYKALMAMSPMPWGKVVVGAKLDRLEVTGISSPDRAADEAVWGAWQDASMDLESKLAIAAALIDGRAHALVWPRNGAPRVTLDDATQMVVEYEEGSRRDRTAALRRWVDDDGSVLATLYRPEGVYKFRRKGGTAGMNYRVGGPAPEGWDGQTSKVTPAPVAATWERREVQGEDWPLRNPFGAVPVVEWAVNRRLKPGRFAHARGEYEHATGIMDRVDLLTFVGLVVAIWMGFPLRGVIGHKILRDDDGNPLPPFSSRPDEVVQFENPEAKLVEYKAADRSNLSTFPELTELAAATSTPRHYLPMEGGIANVSEPTIRAFEGGMHATVNGSHKPTLGEGVEETLRLMGMALERPVMLSPRASTQWADHESRSLGERADAALKLSQAGLPWQGVAELGLGLAQDQINRFESMQSAGVLGELIRGATQGNGVGVGGG